MSVEHWEKGSHTPLGSMYPVVYGWLAVESSDDESPQVCESFDLLKLILTDLDRSGELFALHPWACHQHLALGEVNLRGERSEYLDEPDEVH